MIKNFNAFVTSQNQNGIFENNISEKSIDELPDGDLLVRVEYSSLNYKDALSASGATGITKSYPHTPGIDASGVIEESTNHHFLVGEKVIVTGFDLGMNTSGGFAEYIRVPSSWVVKCPESLSTKESMMIGTAGLTAGLCLEEIEKHKSNMKKPLQADTLNYLGFTTRKLGDFENGEKYYLLGLEIDPNHVGINEYLGELYVVTNRLDLAKERLKVLESCNCEEYTKLKEIIDGTKKSKY